MASLGELKVIYSGGVANVDQQLSLGGLISTAAESAVISQLAGTPAPAISGVTVLDARGHVSYGTGTLRWMHTTSTLYWKRPGGTTFIGLAVSADGIIALGDGSGYLIVQVSIASLPSTVSIDASVSIDPAVNKTFDNISPAQSLAGYTDYRCFYMKNTAAAGTAIDVKMWIKKQPDGDDTLQIALDPAGTNGTALQLVDEVDSTNVLSGITWAAPTTQGTALTIGNLGPGEFRAFWIKRTVPQDTYTQVIENRSALAFSALV